MAERGVFVDGVLQIPPFITDGGLTIQRVGNYIVSLFSFLAENERIAVTICGQAEPTGWQNAKTA